MAVNFEFVSKETIKPSRSTPKHLSHLKLSFFDQFAPIKYSSMLLFYPSCDDAADNSREIANKIHLLKTSLSQILTHYYPLVGRIKDNTVIECDDDDGVEFVETRVNCLLSDMLTVPDALPACKFLPLEVWSSQAATGPLLAIQANFFACGGLVIAVCISHKIADASMVSTFIQAWSKTAQGKVNEDMRPAFVLGSLYPPKDFLSSFQNHASKKRSKFAMRRYVFEESKLAKLKTEAASDAVHHVSRVEALTALVWKCLMNASRSTFGHSRPVAMSQNVNNRKRHVPPLPDNSFGNFIGFFTVHAESDCETDLKTLVSQLRKGLEDYLQTTKKFHEGDAFQTVCESAMKMSNLLKEKDGDLYTVSSVCKFPFYEADFGWGKPKWVTIPVAEQAQNSIYMVDSVEGKGIEVWLTCNEDYAASLDCNEELLQYASANSSVIF